MGPSGSGKTTLLKLLSGQMFSGEFSGIRAINNFVPSTAKYDEVSVVIHSSY
jgi:ABC-type multidrug transport system ATPase subunit